MLIQFIAHEAATRFTPQFEDAPIKREKLDASSIAGIGARPAISEFRDIRTPSSSINNRIIMHLCKSTA